MILKIWALAALLTTGGCITEDEGDGEKHMALGSAMPEFTISGPTGTIESPEYFEGKRTLVVLFRTTCPDCVREMPKIQKVWEEFGEESDFRLAAISKQESGIVADYWAGKEYTMPYYIDTDGSAFTKFEVYRVPTVYLFDTDGKVAYVAIEDADGLSELIESLK